MAVPCTKIIGELEENGNASENAKNIETSTTSKSYTLREVVHVDFRNLDMVKIMQVMYYLLGEQHDAEIEVVLEKKEDSG